MSLRYARVLARNMSGMTHDTVERPAGALELVFIHVIFGRYFWINFGSDGLMFLIAVVAKFTRI